MSRISRSDLDILVERLRCMTSNDYVLRSWNGFWHIYDRSNGEMIITGTTRECYDYMQAYLSGILYAVKNMGASIFID